LLAADYGYSQSDAEPSIRYHTSKSFIFPYEELPFYIEINNPSDADENLLRIDIEFSADVDVRGLDDDCSMWLPNGLPAMVCIIPRVKAGSSRQLDYYIVGDLDLQPGFSSTISVSSNEGSFSIDEQSATSIGLADGDRSIEGATLDLLVLQDVLFDADRDGVPDINETIMGTDPQNPNSFSLEPAVIDIAVLYSSLASDYYGTKISNRIEHLVTATNQFYRNNDVGITIRVVAMVEVEYRDSDASLNETFNKFSAQSHEAFSELESIRINSGADLLLFVHALDHQEGEFVCGVAASNGEFLQGNLDRDTFEGRLLSVVDIGRQCLSQSDLAREFAFNMGIVPSRKENPNGGTFSYSAGHAVENKFTTRVANTSNPNAQFFGSAVKLNKYADPRTLCLGHPCGIDRSDVKNGADVVFSLNATRYLVSDLTPTVFTVSAADLEPRTTVDATTSAGFSLSQSSAQSGAFENDWVEFSAEAKNLSTVARYDLEFRFLNSTNASPIRVSDQRCTIVGETLSDIPIEIDGVVENRGELLCYVAALNPDQEVSFSYSIKVDSADNLDDSSFLRQLGTVNNIAFPESVVCMPIFPDLISAAAGSDVCARLAGLVPEPERVFDLALKPSIDGSILTVPYIRLFDDSLLSVQFRILVLGEISLELLSFEFIDSTLQPEFPSSFSSQGDLEIRMVSLQGAFHNLFLKHVENSDPITFSDLEIIAI